MLFPGPAGAVRWPCVAASANCPSAASPLRARSAFTAATGAISARGSATEWRRRRPVPRGAVASVGPTTRKKRMSHRRTDRITFCRNFSSGRPKEFRLKPKEGNPKSSISAEIRNQPKCNQKGFPAKIGLFWPKVPSLGR